MGLHHFTTLFTPWNSCRAFWFTLFFFIFHFLFLLFSLSLSTLLLQLKELLLGWYFHKFGTILVLLVHGAHKVDVSMQFLNVWSQALVNILWSHTVFVKMCSHDLRLSNQLRVEIIVVLGDEHATDLVFSLTLQAVLLEVPYCFMALVGHCLLLDQLSQFHVPLPALLRMLLEVAIGADLLWVLLLRMFGYSAPKLLVLEGRYSTGDAYPRPSQYGYLLLAKHVFSCLSCTCLLWSVLVLFWLLLECEARDECLQKDIVDDIERLLDIHDLCIDVVHYTPGMEHIVGCILYLLHTLFYDLERVLLHCDLL